MFALSYSNGPNKLFRIDHLVSMLGEPTNCQELGKPHMHFVTWVYERFDEATSLFHDASLIEPRLKLIRITMDPDRVVLDEDGVDFL